MSVQTKALLHARPNVPLQGLNIRQNEGFQVEVHIRERIESLNEFPLSQTGGIKISFKDDPASSTPLRVKEWRPSSTATPGGTAPVIRPTELLVRVRIEDGDFANLAIDPTPDNEEEPGLKIWWYVWLTLPNLTGEQTSQIIDEGIMFLLPKV